MFTIFNAGDIDGRALMHHVDMQNLALEDLDAIIFHDQATKGAVQVVGDDKCEQGTIHVDNSILENVGLKSGDEIEIKKRTPKGGITEVQVSAIPMESQVPEKCIVWVAENASKIAHILKKRPIYRDMLLKWDTGEIGQIGLKIVQTKPGIEMDDIAIIDPTGNEVVFEIVPEEKIKFNAILLIDVSGSMVKEDLVVHDVQEELDRLRESFEIYENFQEFLDQFQEGFVVSRISSAIIATLLYLDLKFKRAMGEYVQVITFGENVEVLEIQDDSGNVSPVIECSGEMGKLNLNTIAWYLTEKTREATGLTSMSVAIKAASDQVENFPINPDTGMKDPTMVVILSDGHPNMGDEDAEIPVNPIPVAKEYLMEDDIVIFTIGLGEADDLLMKKLANDIGRGEYYRATSLKAFWRFYDNLAQKFSIAAKISKEDESTAITEESPQVEEEISEDEPEVEMVQEPEEVEIDADSDDDLDEDLEDLEPEVEVPQITAKTPQVVAKTLDKEPDISIFLMTTIGPGEKNLSLEINPNTTIEDVKKTAGNMFGLNSYDFFLVYGGITLEETKKVKDYKVENGDTLMLIPASTAG